MVFVFLLVLVVLSQGRIDIWRRRDQTKMAIVRSRCFESIRDRLCWPGVSFGVFDHEEIHMRAVHCCNRKFAKAQTILHLQLKSRSKVSGLAFVEITVESTERDLEPGDPLSGPAQASRRSQSTRQRLQLERRSSALMQNGPCVGLDLLDEIAFVQTRQGGHTLERAGSELTSDMICLLLKTIAEEVDPTIQ